jgi:hypothetical protein
MNEKQASRARSSDSIDVQDSRPAWTFNKAKRTIQLLFQLPEKAYFDSNPEIRKLLRAVTPPKIRRKINLSYRRRLGQLMQTQVANKVRQNRI